MIFIEIFPTLLLLVLKEICCHGDAIERSKLLLISIVNYDRNIFANIPLNSYGIILRLNHTSASAADNLDSILNGCYRTNASKCEPIWVTNQRHKHDSALVNWPNQLVYNNTWPTFSFGCVSIPFHLQVQRILDWMSRPHTTLGLMSVNLEMINLQAVRQFFPNISRAAKHRGLNSIVVFIHRNGKDSKFIAAGPNFVNVNNSVRSIDVVDIYGVISHVLQLDGANNDGNASLAALLTTRLGHHVNMDVNNLVSIAGVIGISVILSCIIFIGAVKARNGKLPKINHQYNLGLNTTTRINGFLENEYLLNASDDDECFADAMPHIQTSRQQQ